MKSGTVAEVQLRPVRFHEAKDKLGGAALYEKARALEKGGKPMPGKEAEHARLMAETTRLYSQALAESDPSIAAVVSDFKARRAGGSPALAKKAANSSRQTSSDLREPVVKTSASEGASTQPSPTRKTTTAETGAPASVSTKAGRASQDKKSGSILKKTITAPAAERQRVKVGNTELEVDLDSTQRAELDTILKDYGEELAIPTGDLDANGQPVTRPLREVLGDIEAEQRNVTSLLDCMGGA